jgi:hypothetical protein
MTVFVVSYGPAWESGDIDSAWTSNEAAVIRKYILMEKYPKEHYWHQVNELEVQE